jgi:hypothetical protein
VEGSFKCIAESTDFLLQGYPGCVPFAIRDVEGAVYDGDGWVDPGCYEWEQSSLERY